MIDAQTLAQWPLVQLMQEIERLQGSLTNMDTIVLYRRWLAAAPRGDAYGAHFNIGAMYHADGDLDAAQAEYRKVLALVDLPQARYNLGLALEQAGRYHEAMDVWRPMLAAGNPMQQVAQLGMERVGGRLAQPQDETPVPAPAGDDAVIYAIGVCFNEAAILPFYLDHYIHFVGVKKVILFDGGSTDGTHEIAKRYPQVELVVRVSEKLDDRELMAIRNEEWKAYRNECDWMIVGDVDELLYHPNMRAKLAEFKRDGVTLPMVEGFEMLSKHHPEHVPGQYIWEKIQTGVPNPGYYNKNLIFDPKIDINYTLGCHHCAPTGPVKRSEGFVFKNLHYRMLSYQHIVEKSRRSAARLSDWNKQTNAGFHYRKNAEMPREEYNRHWKNAFNVVNPRPRPQLQRPVLEDIVQHMLALDEDAVIVELGAARQFGRGGDSGSTEQLAWYVHSFGGQLQVLDQDAQVRRHVAHCLGERALMGKHVSTGAMAAGDTLPARIDVLMCNDADFYGDAADRAAVQRRALESFQHVEANLSPEAVVVLDGCEGSAFGGKHQLVAQHLQTRGYGCQRNGYTAVFSKSTLKQN
jgi:hypothetical protein